MAHTQQEVPRPAASASLGFTPTPLDRLLAASARLYCTPVLQDCLLAASAKWDHTPALLGVFLQPLPEWLLLNCCWFVLMPLMPTRSILEHKLDSLRCVSRWECLCSCVCVLNQSWLLRSGLGALGLMAYYPFNPIQTTVDVPGKLGGLAIAMSSPLADPSSPATGPGGSWASNCDK